jgi:hypothetical protein
MGMRHRRLRPFMLVNILGLPLRLGFDLYNASLLSTLLAGFALFADVAIVDL